MGGVASRAWADAVNKAYEAGIVFVAAAGNNFSAGLFGVPTRVHRLSGPLPPRHRRLRRDGRPAALYGLPLRKMQGNWGPASKMATAIAAFTPNMPWAELGCARRSSTWNGAGTSAATPQMAAAAALWLAAAPRLLIAAVRRAVDAGRGGAPGAASPPPTRAPTAAAARSSATASCAPRRRSTSPPHRSALHTDAARHAPRSRCCGCSPASALPAHRRAPRCWLLEATQLAQQTGQARRRTRSKEILHRPGPRGSGDPGRAACAVSSRRCSSIRGRRGRSRRTCGRSTKRLRRQHGRGGGAATAGKACRDDRRRSSGANAAATAATPSAPERSPTAALRGYCVDPSLAHAAGDRADQRRSPSRCRGRSSDARPGGRVPRGGRLRSRRAAASTSRWTSTTRACWRRTACRRRRATRSSTSRWSTPWP